MRNHLAGKTLIQSLVWLGVFAAIGLAAYAWTFHRDDDAERAPDVAFAVDADMNRLNCRRGRKNLYECMAVLRYTIADAIAPSGATTLQCKLTVQYLANGRAAYQSAKNDYPIVPTDYRQERRIFFTFKFIERHDVSSVLGPHACVALRS